MEDKDFDKKDFENVIDKLLHSKPLPKKSLKTSKKHKPRTVLPARPDHPPKREK